MILILGGVSSLDWLTFCIDLAMLLPVKLLSILALSFLAVASVFILHVIILFLFL